MDSERDVWYRLRLGAGFLNEAEEDVRLSRWRSCVDSAQVAVANAIKAVVGRFGPIPCSHDVGGLLDELRKGSDLPPGTAAKLPALKALGERLGDEEHIRSDDGEVCAEGRRAVVKVILHGLSHAGRDAAISGRSTWARQRPRYRASSLGS